MSLTKSAARRRLALFTGSSLAAAGVAALSLGAALTPSAALAQTATCTAGVTPLSGPAVVIPAGTHNPGITCNYTGDGATVTTAGAITVSSTAPANIPLNGVNLTASGADDINWTSTAGTVTGGVQTNGAVIDARTINGDITINTAAVTGTAATVTHGIFAQATGTGNITISNSGNVSGTNSTSGQAGIETSANGGDISIFSRANVSGRLSGIRATNTTGDILIERLGGTAPIVAAGGGDIVIRSGGLGMVGLQTQGRITVDSSSGAGAIHIVNSSGEFGQASTINGLDATIGNGGMIFDITGTGDEAGAISTLDLQLRGTSQIFGGIVLRGAGAAEINLARDGFFYQSPNFASGGEVNLDENYANMRGAFDASNLHGGLTINVDGGGSWIVEANPVLSPANDAVRVGDGGFLLLPINPSSSAERQTIDFGGGDANSLTIEAGGHVLVGVKRVIGNAEVPGSFGVTDRSDNEAELRFDNLQTFANDGDIWMGTSVLSNHLVAGIFPEGMIRYQGTDQVADDILSLPGATFVGGPNGRIHIDANLNSIDAEQTGCDNSHRDAGGSLPIADCINLQNGAIEGVVLISVTQTVEGGRGAFNPDGNVIIDMSDGAGGPGSGAGLAADAIVGFAPESRFYNPASGGIIDNGMFAYHLFYDAEAMQVKMVGVPSAGAFHQPLIANAAQAAWRTANGTYFDRQADLRDTLRAGDTSEHGVWMRAAYEAAERATEQAFTIPSGDITYDNTHDVITTAVTLGADFIGGGDGDQHWVAGGMIGYVRTDMEYAEFWTDTAKLNGMMVGLYGTWINGPMFVDAVASGVWSEVVQDMPQAELFRERDLSNNAHTMGGRIEAGWSLDLGMFQLDPLVHAAWSRTALKDFQVPEDDPAKPGNQVTFEKAVSTRAGVGLRGSTVLPMAGLDVGLSLTGRYSKEFDGEASAAIGNLNPISPVVTDEFAGDFGEVIGGVTVADPSGRVSGALNLGARQGDDYDAFTASASFRYQW